MRRARYASLAGLGQRIGYLLLVVAVAAFAVALATGLALAAVMVSVAALIAACVVLPPAIVASYAVKAAEGDDRRAGRVK